MFKLMISYINKYFNKPAKPTTNNEYYYDDFDDYYPDNSI